VRATFLVCEAGEAGEVKKLCHALIESIMRQPKQQISQKKILLEYLKSSSLFSSN
jgi:hypothetical protein